MSSSLSRPLCVRGYTLLEMLVVVAIVAALAALTMPAMRAPLSKSELRDAAKQLRTELARTRLEAIESGTVMQFRFHRGRRLFEVTSKSLPDGGDPSQQTENEPVEHELPSGVYFYDQQAPERPEDDAERSAGIDAEKWSTPILFYPNGRTTTARIWLVGQRNFYVDVTLRGVTGTAKVGQLVRREQQP